jgi:hypothetical protein
LVSCAADGWRSENSTRTFDQTRDFAGPVTVAQAFERTVGDRQQRVVVAGTGHFLSNTYLGNGGNLALGLSMVNWLAGADNLVTVQPRSAADATFDIDQTTLYLIAFSFLLALPLAFVVTGMIIWWRRRRAS